MKHKTNVIHKGVFYPAGTDVPVGEDDKNTENVSEEIGKPKRGRKPKEA